MILTESEIEETALDLLKKLNGYQVAYGPDLAEGVYDAHCPALRAGRIRAGSVRAGSIRANPVGAGSVRAGSEPAPTIVIHIYPEPAQTAAIYEFAEPAHMETI